MKTHIYDPRRDQTYRTRGGRVRRIRLAFCGRSIYKLCFVFRSRMKLATCSQCQKAAKR